MLSTVFYCDEAKFWSTICSRTIAKTINNQICVIIFVHFFLKNPQSTPFSFTLCQNLASFYNIYLNGKAFWFYYWLSMLFSISHFPFRYNFFWYAKRAVECQQSKEEKTRSTQYDGDFIWLLYVHWLSIAFPSSSMLTVTWLVDRSLATHNANKSIHISVKSIKSFWQQMVHMHSSICTQITTTQKKTDNI